MRTLSFLVMVGLLASTLSGFVLLHQNASYVIGGKYVLHEGEVLRGDLNVFFAQVTLEEGASITGHLFALSSDVKISGIVEQNVLSLESDLRTSQTARFLGEQHEVNWFNYVVLMPELSRWQVAR